MLNKRQLLPNDWLFADVPDGSLNGISLGRSTR